MITCVMVTGKPRGFINMPEIAVQCFLDQEYQDCHLLIINHGEKNFSGRNIWDIKVKKTNELHVGALRNMAFDLAGGDYFATWDDDDWHHPKRLAFQARFARPGKMVLFKNRIHVDLTTSRQGFRTFPSGALSTMLFPSDTKNRFPNWKKTSDAQFFYSFASNTIVIDNPPEFYIRTAHGENINHNDFIMEELLPMSDVQNQLVEKIRGLYKPAIVSDK